MPTLPSSPHHNFAHELPHLDHIFHCFTIHLLTACDPLPVQVVCHARDASPSTAVLGFIHHHLFLFALVFRVPYPVQHMEQVNFAFKAPALPVSVRCSCQENLPNRTVLGCGNEGFFMLRVPAAGSKARDVATETTEKRLGLKTERFVGCMFYRPTSLVHPWPLRIPTLYCACRGCTGHL